MPARRVHNRRALKERRRQLRNQSTPAEAVLWRYLRGCQLEGRKFRRQHSVGPYVVDFYCPEERLAVELDGAVHDDPARRAYDALRQDYLHGQGIRVVRFENRRVFDDPNAVLRGVIAFFGLPNR